MKGDEARVAIRGERIGLLFACWLTTVPIAAAVAPAAPPVAATVVSAAVPPAGVDLQSAPWKSYVLDRGRNRVEFLPSRAGPSFLLNVVAVADTPAAWHVQATLASPEFRRLDPATLYVLRFRGYAARARAVRVEMTRGASSAPILRRTVALAEAPRDYDVSFRTPSELSADPLELAFHAGEERGAAWVEDVRLERGRSLAYRGDSLELAGFEPGESWSHGAADSAHARRGRGGLALSAAANGAVFAERDVALDLSRSGWRLVLWVHTSAPENLGRLGLYVRSGQDGGRDFAFRHVSGLTRGWNRVVIPRESFVTYPWLGTIDWSAVRSVGLRLEANGNGRASLTVDDLRAEPAPARDDRGPVVERVNALGSGPTTARVEFRLDEAGSASVEYGTRTTYGARATARGTSGARAFAVTLRGLAPGRRYHARVRALDRHGNPGRSGDFTFVTGPAAPPVPRGAGLPVGIFTVGGVSEVRRRDFSGLEHVGRTPFTHVSTFFFSDCDQPDEVTRAYLDRAHALGKKVLMTFCTRQVEPGTLDPGAVRERVRRYREHPALDAWYLYDEPDGSGVEARRFGEALRESYRAVKSEDPLHPVVLHLARADRAAPFHDSMDAIATDTYPVPYHPVDAIVGNLDAARAGGLPWRFTFQSYATDADRWPGDAPGDRIAGRYPSYGEMRAMAYLAANRGASQLWTYAYSYLHDTPGSEWHWTELTALVQELRRFGPLLVSRTTPLRSVARTSDPALDVATRRYAGADYLIVVNRTGRTIAGTVDLTGATPAAFRDLMTPRSLAPRRGALADSWAPYEVRIYHVPSTRPTR